MTTKEISYPPLASEDELIRLQLTLDEYVTGIGWLGKDKLAAGTASGSLYFIEIPSGNIIRKIEAHSGSVQSLSTNGTDLIATGGQDGMVHIYEWASGQPVAEVEMNADWIETVEYSPDGNFLLAVAGTGFSLLKARGELVYDFPKHESTVSGVCWRADSKQFASACYSAVRFFDVRYKVPQQTLKWQNSMISISWSPDFKFICSGTQDSRIHFWPLPYKEGSDFEMTGYRGKVRNLSWDAKARFNASNSWNEVILWPFNGTAPMGKRPVTLSHAAERITAILFQKNTTVLAVGDKGGLLVFYDPLSGEDHLAAVQLKSEIVQVAWAENDEYLAAGTADGTLYVLDSIS